MKSQNQVEPIQLNRIEVEAIEFLSMKLFVESLEFPETNEKFWKDHGEELGNYVYTF
jgi:hypothetical protein